MSLNTEKQNKTKRIKIAEKYNVILKYRNVNIPCECEEFNKSINDNYNSKFEIWIPIREFEKIKEACNINIDIDIPHLKTIKIADIKSDMKLIYNNKESSCSLENIELLKLKKSVIINGVISSQSENIFS